VTRTTTTHATTSSSAPNQPVIGYHEVQTATLPTAVQDPATAAFADGAIVAAGGIDSSCNSTAAIVRIDAKTARAIGTLPEPQHDASGAAIGTTLYAFGGGHNTSQFDHIIAVDSVTGQASNVGQLPALNSDSIAVTIGSTAYIVGGYDGSRFLDTVLAYTPSGGVRVAGHLPVGVRYPAVAAAGNTIIVAGGSTPSATATSDIYAFDVTTGTARRIGALDAPVTHAAAAAFDGALLVIGGRTASLAPVAAITAVDPATGAVKSMGNLAAARGDMGVAVTASGITLVGGRTANGPTDIVTHLVADYGATNIYGAAGANMLNPVSRLARPLVYVPNSVSNTLDVIDPTTYKVIAHYTTGTLPMHVTPSYDMKTLYVDVDRGWKLIPIDPTTGVPGTPISVDDPYNLYFTPDGKFAIVVAEALHRLDFRDPHTMQMIHSLHVPCTGVDHMDFSADGSFALASCEFSGDMLRIDLATQQVSGTIPLRAGSRPQDVKLAPDGSVFYVADMNSNGIWEIDATGSRVIGFIATGRGAHGLYPSRDATKLYVTNREAGTITVLDFATKQIVATWTIPGGTPDMGGVSADGKVLWISGRYSGEVYAIDTSDGHLIARIKVGAGPHGVCVWPQPGRYSLGHTGVTR
jgi:YVTN family beta-propeller protein